LIWVDLPAPSIPSKVTKKAGWEEAWANRLFGGQRS
jgi:hypothetical protein